MSVEFLDSNIFVYLFDETDPGKREVAQALVLGALEARSGCISHQVVQETLNVLTRKLAKPASPEDARRFFERILRPLWQVMPSAALYLRALDLQSRYRYGFYDSLIIAAALQAGCSRLYSEDLQDGQRIETLIIENPFRAPARP